MKRSCACAWLRAASDRRNTTILIMLHGMCLTCAASALRLNSPDLNAREW